MGSDFEQFKDAVPAVAASPSAGIEPPSDTADVLACIGYEAADPSLFSPQWRETHGLPHQRDLR